MGKQLLFERKHDSGFLTTLTVEKVEDDKFSFQIEIPFDGEIIILEKEEIDKLIEFLKE